MKKKTVKKLVLAKETVRELDYRLATGGLMAITSVWVNCGTFSDNDSVCCPPTV
jgi:hypothetical protein